MKKSITAFLLLVILSTARADIMSVADAATEANTASSAASALESLDKLDNQYTLLVNQLNSLQRSVERLENIGDYDSAAQYINQINGIMNQLNGIYHSAELIEKDFQTLYPGYEPSNSTNQYESMVNSSLNTLNNAVESTVQVTNSLSTDKTTLDNLQTQSNQVQGQTQAIILSNQLLAQTNSQLQMVQQIMVAQTQAQSAYYAEQLQDEARAEADITNAISNGITTAPDIGHSGQTVSFPTSLDY